ncbi:enoyl-CoA hydratase-related protein [Novosphingobium malaysiense]|uniref:Enoyl-CoA hydratase n=1 Tax=Novosphingobium malaysiense TaxID=1348853 RepID=A0A0B1ZFA3_9SPHN|nr:enoyl-CoA hydratase-related protein [Novosphingobium malaysiense]KHK89165.1 enoyl-CoA hydratase [Novosphingobium malaysiense]
MADNILIDEPVEGVKRLTLNRPEAMNAFTNAMYLEFIAILEDIKYDPDCRVVILTGNGRGFCTGHDLRDKEPPSWVKSGVGKAYNTKYSMEVIASIPKLLRNLPQPVICGVNGTVAGMGYAFPLAADMAIAGQSAKFINAIHNAATGAELGMSYMLPRAVGAQKAAEILYTARRVSAEEAAEIGLVLKTVPDDQLQDECVALAKDIAVNVPMGIWVTKQSLWHNMNAGSLEQAMEFETRGVFMAQSTEDAKEKRAAFLEKREPKFSGK